MNILIIFPHGLGDCLMLTPILREYYNTYRVKLSVAILERFKTSEIFNNNPYVDRVFPVLKDVWNDFSNSDIGFFEVQKMGEQLAIENNMSSIFINHPRPRHKVLINAESLRITLNSYNINVFISNNEREIANELINKFVGNNPYGFIQTHTGAGNRELPEGFGKKWLKKNMGLNHFIEVDKTYHHKEYNINIQFEMLRRASAVCLTESVFYCACGGLNKNVDFVYCPNGIDAYNRIKNLDSTTIENVFYEIPSI